MKKLILFDIDGTLIDSPRDNRFVEAINKLHKLDIEIEKSYRGFTDQLILIDLLKNVGWSDEQIGIAMPKLLKELDRLHEFSFQKGSIKLFPGVKELLSSLKERRIKLGLITGNLKNTAGRKLEDAKIYAYFSVGGFGSDSHTSRSELIEIAVKRAGYQNHKDDVYVVGDTPLDVLAAKEAGIVNIVGVTHGYRETQELMEVGAKVVLEDFKDTSEVLSKLDL